MPERVYAPVLKGRQGEFAALADIQQSTREQILPLVEIVPGPDDTRTTLRQVIEKSVRRLEPWAGRRLLLDAGLLQQGVPIADGRSVVGHAAAFARSRGVEATPVVRLNDEVDVRAEAARVHREHGGGVAVRLGLEDLEDDPEDAVEAVEGLLRELGVRPPDVDLVFDLGAVVGELAVHAGARFAADLLRSLPDVDDWRYIIVTGGAFPVDLSETEAWQLGEYPRYDAQLFDRLVSRRRIPRIPMFGDYAVANPLLVVGNAFPAPPQLRYTVADRWLVMKGRRNDPRGHEQFFLVCDHISRHPDFAGAALGNADERIVRARDFGPGNASTWRQIGTTHHLDYVVQRLTNLGEP